MKPEKQYYLIEMEAMVPTIVKYKVLAESPEDALQKPIDFGNCTTKPILAKLKKNKVKITEIKTSKVVFQK